MMRDTPTLDHYLCDQDEIDRRLAAIDPRAYDKSRNHLEGAVTWLSPFLTHGIIDTSTIAAALLARRQPQDCYRLLFELAWREYFHRVWQLHTDAIFEDMRQSQLGVEDTALPTAITQSATGIKVLDRCLEHLQSEGLIHNHARLWLAGVICNMARTHWHEPARWFHYHLLDGDLASNTLSWQWVAGTFSHKKYVANQANINQFSSVREQGTWLDVPYEDFEDFPIPQALAERTDWQVAEALPADLDSLLPGKPVGVLDGSVAIFSLWQLDPTWQPDVSRRILFIDTLWHRQWPMSDKRWQLIGHWADRLNLEIRHGTVDELRQATEHAEVVRREYPACHAWPGRVEQRRWLYPMPEQPFNSFSRFWKQVRGSVGL